MPLICGAAGPPPIRTGGLVGGLIVPPLLTNAPTRTMPGLLSAPLAFNVSVPLIVRMTLALVNVRVPSTVIEPSKVKE